jgi:hypothetical protein
LGIDLPGMASKGTMERPDALPSSMLAAAVSAEGSARLAEEEEMPGSDDDCDGSEIMNESVVSSVVDRYN